MELADKDETGGKWLIGLIYAVGCSVHTENHLYGCYTLYVIGKREAREHYNSNFSGFIGQTTFECLSQMSLAIKVYKMYKCYNI